MMKFSSEVLINKYNRGLCSDEESALVESWHLKDLAESDHLPSKEKILEVNEKTKAILSLHTGYVPEKRVIVKLWPKVALIASLLCVISTIGYYYLSRQDTNLTAKIQYNDILPGQNKAILTLQSGKKMSLTNVKSGLVAIQGEMVIQKTIGGKLIYHGSPDKNSSTNLNKLETPRGGQYQLELPDGTKVWLNSASSISYPVSFSAKERNVELTGEAYFEVAKDKKRPFKIRTGQQMLEVLGTHFNINAYPDNENILTTLLEGSLKVSNGLSDKIIKPGQEAITNNQTKTISIESADIEKNIAWKNNEFIFNGDNLNSIMKSIGRWYDVEIIYQSNSDQTKYWGVVSRSKNISSVLKMLQSTGKAKFKIEGRRITVMN